MGAQGLQWQRPYWFLLFLLVNGLEREKKGEGSDLEVCHLQKTILIVAPLHSEPRPRSLLTSCKQNMVIVNIAKQDPTKVSFSILLIQLTPERVPDEPYEFHYQMLLAVYEFLSAVSGYIVPKSCWLWQGTSRLLLLNRKQGKVPADTKQLFTPN